MTDPENPYQAPETSMAEIGPKSMRAEELRAIARYQKGVILCVLFYVLSYASLMGAAAILGDEPNPFVVIPIGLMLFVTIVAGFVLVLLLAMRVYGITMGILIGLLGLVPCIGLLVLLMVNARATTILRENGVRVGFLGAQAPPP